MLEKIKNSLKSNEKLQSLVGLYFDIVGDFKEDNLVDLYNEGINLGAINIEEAIKFGIKNHKKEYSLIKEIINKQKAVEGEIPTAKETNEYIDSHLAKSKNHSELVERLTKK